MPGRFNPAGRGAAQRDYWLLAQHGTDPRTAELPYGTDPAILTAAGPSTLREHLDSAQPLGRALLDDLLNEAQADTVDLAVALIAAQPPQAWPAQASLAGQRLGIDATQLTHQLVAQVQTWNSDPAGAAASAIDEFAQRPTAPQAPPPAPWVSLADRVDPRLTSEPDWLALAHMLTAVQDNGADPVRLVHQAMAEGPLGNMPAQDLRYRLVALHQLPATPYSEPEPTRQRPNPQQDSHQPSAPDRLRPSGPSR